MLSAPGGNRDIARKIVKVEPIWRHPEKKQALKGVGGTDLHEGVASTLATEGALDFARDTADEPVRL
jgi:hypothetical protein